MIAARLIEDVRAKVLDQLVFRRPTALRERVPPHLPLVDSRARSGLRCNSQVAPDHRRPGRRLTSARCRRPAGGPGRCPARSACAVRLAAARDNRGPFPPRAERTGRRRSACAAMTSVYRSGVSRRSISDRLRTYLRHGDSRCGVISPGPPFQVGLDRRRGRRAAAPSRRRSTGSRRRPARPGPARTGR